MNYQIRELLCKIPASPETDELQNLLEQMHRERLRKSTIVRDALLEAKAGLEFAKISLPDLTPNSTINLALQEVRKGLNETLG